MRGCPSCQPGDVEATGPGKALCALCGEGFSSLVAVTAALARFGLADAFNAAIAKADAALASNLECPACSAPFITVLLHGEEMRVCLRCNAVWLHAGALDRIAAAKLPPMSSAASASASASAAPSSGSPPAPINNSTSRASSAPFPTAPAPSTPSSPAPPPQVSPRAATDPRASIAKPPTTNARVAPPRAPSKQADASASIVPNGTLPAALKLGVLVALACSAVGAWLYFRPAQTARVGDRDVAFWAHKVDMQEVTVGPHPATLYTSERQGRKRANEQLHVYFVPNAAAVPGAELVLHALGASVQLDGFGRKIGDDMIFNGAYTQRVEGRQEERRGRFRAHVGKGSAWILAAIGEEPSFATGEEAVRFLASLSE